MSHVCSACGEVECAHFVWGDLSFKEKAAFVGWNLVGLALALLTLAVCAVLAENFIGFLALAAFAMLFFAMLT